MLPLSLGLWCWKWVALGYDEQELICTLDLDYTQPTGALRTGALRGSSGTEGTRWDGSIFPKHPQMPINASNALTLAHQLRVYTAEAAGFSDMMDVVYVAQMIQKFLGYVDQIKEVRFN